MTTVTIARGSAAAAGLAQGAPIEAADEFSAEPSMFRGASIDRAERVTAVEVAALLRSIADDIEAHSSNASIIDIGSTEKMSGAKDVVVKIAFSTAAAKDRR